MENLLKWVVTNLYVLVWGRLSWLLGPTRDTDGIPARFHRVLHRDVDRRVEVLILPGDVGLHIVLILSDETGQWWMIDGGRRLDIRPCTPRQAAVFIRRLRPTWRVSCWVNSLVFVDTVFEPNTCVLSTRALLGIDEPMVSYPEQLLNYLWRS